MTNLSQFLIAHSRALNIVINFLLSILILLSYIPILILYVSPQSYHLPSLLNPSASGIKPTTAVTLVTAVLAAATSGLITRCVEQSLWLKLSPRTVKRHLTVKESRRLAQWSVSPIAHLTYVFDGDSWLLKVGGILLIAITIVGPVLLSGISPVESLTTSRTSKNHDTEIWTGWIDAANEAYNGGNFQDIPGIAAALATLSNLSAPASPVCSDPSCQVDALATSIRANCDSSYLQYENSPHEFDRYTTICSSRNLEICTSLAGESTYANFSSGFPPGHGHAVSGPPGDWAVIFGAFINATDTANGPWYLNTVDCALSYGTVTIHQVGGSTPAILDGSFEKSDNATVDGKMVALRRIYTSESGRSPYTFNAGTGGAGDGSDSLYNSPVATLLLGAKANSSAEAVARRIEDIFNMSTLLAFSRMPNASDLTIITSEPITQYAYDRRVLAILLVPFIATILGTWGRWRVEGTEKVVGYDPVGIAKRGPVHGLPDCISGDDMDRKRVLGYKETSITPTGVQVDTDRFAVGVV